MDINIILYAAVIVLVVLAAVFFFIFISRKIAGRKYFADLVKKNHFRFLKPNVEVFRVKGLENIINKDFLVSDDYSLSIKAGAVRYDLQETVLISDGVIEEVSPKEGKKGFSCHCSFFFHHNPAKQPGVSGMLKIRKNTGPQEKDLCWCQDLAFILKGEEAFYNDFVVSSESEISIESIPSELKEKMAAFTERFPFKNKKSKGVVIITSKGWLVLGVQGTSKAMYDSLLVFDRTILG